jgi:hypothetical protein
MLRGEGGKVGDGEGQGRLVGAEGAQVKEESYLG